jgi:hypothetical protein
MKIAWHSFNLFPSLPCIYGKQEITFLFLGMDIRNPFKTNVYFACLKKLVD